MVRFILVLSINMLFFIIIFYYVFALSPPVMYRCFSALCHDTKSYILYCNVYVK